MSDGIYQSVGADTFVYSSLLRLRQELSKLILKHAEKISDPATRSATQGKFYEFLLSGLSVSHVDIGISAHI